jgi:hypothetical protein
MHKKEPGAFAFTLTADEQIKSSQQIKEAFGLDHVFLRVSDHSGNEYYCVEYQNKDRVQKKKYANVYLRKPKHQSTEKKRGAWGRNLAHYFNKYSDKKFSSKGFGTEYFKYAGELHNNGWINYLADFITNDDVVTIMMEDYSLGEKPLTCDAMAKDSDLVEMYFGPKKILEGKAALLSRSNAFNAAESEEEDSKLKPYESEDDEE